MAPAEKLKSQGIAGRASEAVKTASIPNTGSTTPEAAPYRKARPRPMPRSRSGSDTAAPSATPQATVLPENMMPDPEDGEVNDRDGIITDDDNGTDTKSDTAAERTANGNANGSAAGIGNGIGKNSTTGTGKMSASKR